MFAILTALLLGGLQLCVLAAPAATPSPKPAPPLSSSLSAEQSITSGGQTRNFYYYRPASFSPSNGIIFYLHGGGGNGAGSFSGSTDYLWPLLADRVGVLVIFPNGKCYTGEPTKCTWNDCTDGTRTTCKTCTDWDDVQFIRDLIPWATQNIDASIDTSKVYAAGESEGGQMVERLALEANDVIAAVGNVAGNLPVSNDNSANGAYKCQGYTAPWTPGSGQAVPILLFKGDNDPRIPYGNNTPGVADHNNYCQYRDKPNHSSTPPCRDGAVHSFYDTVAFWQWKLGISGSPTTQAAPSLTTQYADTVPDCTTSLQQCDGSYVVRSDYAGSGQAVPLRVEVARGGGHAFPGPDVESQAAFSKPLGWKNRDYLGQPNHYIAEEMYAFFSQFTLAY